MDEIFERLNQPFRTLPDVLDALVRDIVQHLHLQTAAVTLPDDGTFVARRGRRRVVSERLSTRDGLSRPEEPRSWASGVDAAVHAAEWFEVGEPHALFEPPPAAGAVSLPLAYADQALGRLDLAWRSEGERRRETPAWLPAFARQCALLVNRYKARDWTARRLGRPLMLVGMSKAVRDLEGLLERAARSDLPVLLAGEFGTEKLQLAAMIHFGGRRRDGAFVQVNCAEPAVPPSDWFEQAAGGTLYLNGVEELSHPLQRQLPRHMRSHLGQWPSHADLGDVRVIASTAVDLRRLAHEGGFSRGLLAELDILSVTAPPLRARPGDLEPLVVAALERQGFRAEDKRTDAMMAAIRAYSWPENVFELERVVTRLAVMTGARPIGRDDILQHSPWIASDGAPAPVALLPPATPPSRPDRWVRCALDDAAELDSLHDALARALRYLGRHYAEPISLGLLARRANVSESHLSFLFRSEIDLPFKGLLGRIRIHRAKEILAAEPRRQITDVALSVGFADLSHFEKTFKRVVGRSPREFRRAAA
ncbi:AraC family transcriptional regulator [Caulobacter sp. CCUG 60055]|uniref:helix-turn-helix domain-containing protein n=1 Tax=Caulobacter sp. CCUG 60055 TaxID=2100090 RepID=UPI001FA765EB